jgi:hypothetical protein
MELTFPFKNIAINTLLDFFEIGKVVEFYESKTEEGAWKKEYFDLEVQNYQDRIPDFENEIIQVIDTTGQETIDAYFKTLSNELHYVKGLLHKGDLSEKIDLRNDLKLEKFEASIKEKEEDFMMSPDRKRKHLEIYEYDMGVGGLIPISRYKAGGGKVTKTNYNFYCIEEKLDYIDPAIIDEYFPFLSEQSNLLFDVGRKYGVQWESGKIKSKLKGTPDLKPIVFCEGDIDVELLQKAAELLNKTTLISKIELRYRGSCSNLDKLWSILTDNNWETVPQKKILLYDCDTNRADENFGYFYRRMIPKQEGHTVKRGIENLFPVETIDRALVHKPAFVDFKKVIGTERGVSYERIENIINKHEKRNFCGWILANGDVNDFEYFNIVFDIIEALI